MREPRTRFMFSIIHKGSVAGAVELNIRDIHNSAGEVGYIVNPKYWGKGFATEAALLIIGYGFKELKLHRIFATCDPRNIGSSKVLEKAGMKKEGLLRENVKLKDGWRDSLLYSILEDEWHDGK